MRESADLLFELGTEELPPVALEQLSAALTQGFTDGLQNAGLEHGAITSFATPRRLGVMIRACALRQPDREIERRGPALRAAFDADGNPTKAASGFARSCGTTVDALERTETDKGTWLMYRLKELGKPAAELLPDIAENALNRLPIPKRMRWGASEAQFVRPVHWLLFLHGDQVVPCTILDATSGSLSYGHRFHHPEALQITTPDSYEETLYQQGYVIARFDRRRAKVAEQVERSAQCCRIYERSRARDRQARQ